MPRSARKEPKTAARKKQVSPRQRAWLDGLIARICYVKDTKPIDGRVWSRAASQSESYVESIVNGRSLNPQMFKIIDLANAVGVAPSWLLLGEGPWPFADSTPKSTPSP